MIVVSRQWNRSKWRW